MCSQSNPKIAMAGPSAGPDHSLPQNPPGAAKPAASRSTLALQDLSLDLQGALARILSHFRALASPFFGLKTAGSRHWATFLI
jgi:hypothetical protein